MGEKERHIELIENYLHGKLTREEQIEFERSRLQDEQFAKLFEETKNVISGIRYAGRVDLERELKELDVSLGDVEIEHQKRFAVNLWAVGIAASLIVALGIYFTFMIPGSVTQNDLYQSYFEPYPNIVDPSLRAGDSLINGFYYYDREEYLTAIEYFNEQLNQQKSEHELFYLGVSLMSNNQYSEAILIFDQYHDNYETLSTQASWYKGLCYLKLGDRDKVVLALDPIKSNSVYGEKVNSILINLKP